MFDKPDQKKADKQTKNNHHELHQRLRPAKLSHAEPELQDMDKKDRATEYRVSRGTDEKVELPKRRADMFPG